jgi:hypothetical protein
LCFYIAPVSFYSSMVPRFHFTASIQPPTVSFDPSLPTPPDGSKLSLNVLPDYADPPDETIRNLIARVNRLEVAVFKESEASNEVNGFVKPETDSKLQQLADISPDALTDTAWSALIDAMGKRLDACAGQPSVNECVLSMRQLKRDLVTLSQSLSDCKMNTKQMEAVRPFLGVQSPPSEVSSEPNPKQSKKEATPWKAVIPRGSFKPSSGPGLRSGAPNADKKWGPCFYCSCTEWKPGHTCEGSRLAQQRKKERESRAV